MLSSPWLSRIIKHTHTHTPITMESLLSPVIANFYTEKFEETVLCTAPLRPHFWFRYMHDTFVVWNHGGDQLPSFLEHINSIHQRIRFRIEKEATGQVAFFDVWVIKWEDLKLGQRVYQKPTHTGLDLHKDFHPRQKHAMMKALVNQASCVCELQYLKRVVTSEHWFTR